ncbi:MAG: cyclic nucleotide-binding domain-containing protein [Deltaproteobacteria bacterium]|nr:cyclic nucleotide-binding domain-containing protein [Deltaproteobacteria bacterium]
MLFHRRSQKIDLLRKVPLFNKLNKRQLNEIGKYADELPMKAGQMLAQQDKRGLDFDFIVEGKARVEKDGEFIRYLTAGDFFGEIAIIDGAPRTATVIAETDMTLLVVSKRSFDYLLDTVPGLQKKMLVSLCSYLRRAEMASPRSHEKEEENDSHPRRA